MASRSGSETSYSNASRTVSWPARPWSTHQLALPFAITTSPQKLMTLKEFDAVCRPFADADPRKQPAEMAIQLYTYQLKALGWMIGLEDRIRRGQAWQIPHLAKWSESSLLFDLQQKKFYLKEPSRPFLMHTRGGILADQMGLGKTMIIVGLMIANPSPSRRIDILHSTRARAVEDEDESLIPTPATLVVAPAHLVKQVPNCIFIFLNWTLGNSCCNLLSGKPKYARPGQQVSSMSSQQRHNSTK